ncbi:membrane protein [Klebsiella pneumoniae]|uniref:Membrane protein n=1 Tax=Klebsiella pneumoniae TaxID=573 RepID=A0A378F5J7_KLEPN|nr:membrane protein [Klebsiella pneumoniae]
MEMVLRAAAIYLILLIIFKIAGRRTLMQLTNFDLILLLIISEATQQAMLSTDYSVTGSMLTIVTLVSIDILFGYIKKNLLRQKIFSMVRRLSWWKMVLSSTRRLSSSISLSMISCWRPGSTMAFMN